MSIKTIGISKNTSLLQHRSRGLYGLIIGLLIQICPAEFMLEGVTHCLKFGSHNTCQIQIQAKQASADLHLTTMQLKQVKAIIKDTDLWTIQADEAAYSNQLQTLILTGHVFIQHIDQDSNKTIYKTKRVTYNVLLQTISTPERIDIYNKNNHLQAAGMIANLKKKKIKLLDQVHIVIKETRKGSSKS